eukprot:CAMPEP_0194442358 /NCGR_PEP_ID=MMETSP0176-20130528/126081_1 /TAXON_ID=216777 /ORGANISM="Proboscia alata, Strain PI-D3" /LENGTH=778 /DNA_ID=CAMNT_0039268443 /DNA_START=241 /DNA_END=2574 /DNA_ORIENTATION=-
MESVDCTHDWKTEKQILGGKSGIRTECQTFHDQVNWLQVYGKGSQEDPANTYLEFFGPDSPYLPREGYFYIRRLCVDCGDSHKDIIYKRLTPLPDGFSIFDYFVGEWASQDNELNEDFELYSNMLDALNDRNQWQFCNYDYYGIGFPRECGPDGFVGGQWTSLTRGGPQSNYGFYVYRANVDTEPPLPPQQDEDSLDRWWQVFGKGSQRNDVDPTLWEAGSPFIPLDREFYIRRICPNCRESHKDIIYKRVTLLSADFDLPSLFLDTWSSEDNKLITPDNAEGDFELYSSMSFALAGLMPWQFCNYDDNNLGFPRDCGPDGLVGDQWNSLNRGGQSDYGYYVWLGTPDSPVVAPTFAPTGVGLPLSCVSSEVWIDGFSLNGCTVASILEEVEALLPETCTHEALTDLKYLFNVDSDADARESIQTMCEDGWSQVDATEFQDVDPNFDSAFMTEYIQGDTYINHDTGTFQGTAEGENIADFCEGQAKVTKLGGVDGLKECQLNSIMCCFGRDRQPNDNNGNCADPIENNCVDADPGDNSNLCYAEYDNSIYPGESEGVIHCQGLAWADDRGDFSYQLQHNNFFYVSLYDHMYQRGYVENTVESNEVPMCACMEDMKIKVSRADCTQIDVVLTFNIKYERGSLRASPGNDLHVEFNPCQGTNPSNENDESKNNDLASHIFKLYKEGKISEGTKDAVFDTLVGYDAEPGNNASEEACSRAYEDAIGDQYFTPTDEWLQVYGKGSLEDSANTYLEFFGPDSPYLPREGNFYIRRLCVDCGDS